MANNSLDFMKDVMGAPFGDLISSVGQGVAEAQAALDAGSVAQTVDLYTEGGDEMVVRMREMGYVPTFYSIPETEVEAQVSLTFSVQETSNSSPSSEPANSFTQMSKAKMYATPVNAAITNKFNLNVNASAKIKFKIVAVPPPAGASEIRVVPTLVGKSLASADSLLTQFSLLREITTGPEDGIITTQDLAAGTVVVANQSIKIELRACVMPNLSGLTKTAAEAALAAEALVGTFTGTLTGTVSAQSVAAGTVVPADSNVNVTMV